MLTGELYDAMDEQLVQERLNAQKLIQQFNGSAPDDLQNRNRILKKLIPNCGEKVFVQPPFFCDYGSNITPGDGVFFNFNCVVLDVAPVHIGSRTLLGPNVQIYTATHPLNFKERTSGLESGEPITIGEDVWIGGSAVICPGVTIGSRTVVAAGSVVVKDLPSDVLAAGNPCRVIRSLNTNGEEFVL